MKTFKKKFNFKKDFENEVFFLEKLSKYDCFPKIIKILNMEIEMSFCGINFVRLYGVKDWKQQIKKILNILQKEKIYHNDSHESNFLCKNKKIFLIDFAWASLNKERKPYCNINYKDIEKCKNFLELITITKHKTKIKRIHELELRKSKTS
jgi:tRNA A-37 threonylcarbamoyl transferase component Bud32